MFKSRVQSYTESHLKLINDCGITYFIFRISQISIKASLKSEDF